MVHFCHYDFHLFRSLFNPINRVSVLPSSISGDSCVPYSIPVSCKLFTFTTLILLFMQCIFTLTLVTDPIVVYSVPQWFIRSFFFQNLFDQTLIHVVFTS